jgi:3-dehydroquinate dehydratase type I
LAGGTDLVEFRIDLLRSPIFEEITSELRKFAPLSVFTLRPAREGGGFEGKEPRRLALIRAIGGLKPAHLDVELRTLAANPGLLSENPIENLIVSWHDLVRTPGRARLHAIMMRAESFGGLSKIVATANDPADNLAILSLYGRPERRPIAFCMGDHGVFSRVMAIQLGSPMAYASLPGDPTASGQLTLGQALAIRRRLQDA